VLIEPDHTTNLEVGAHSVLFDGRLVLNGAVYTIDWERIQTLGVTENGAIPITVNGGSARSRGLEVSFQIRGDGPWSFAGTYGYNDAKLASDAPGIVDGIGDENGDGIVDQGDEPRSGDRLAGTPEHMASFSVGFERRLTNGWDLDAAYGLTATSDVLTKVGLRGNGETLGGYTLHSASVALSHDQWSATLYADNLTNKLAFTSVRQDASYVRDVGTFALRRYYRDVLRPRSVGVEFRYSFGD
jgi:outer membrane receptor protein involved in Fe transport